MVSLGTLAGPSLRRWFAFGTGASITIQGDNLDVALVRSRPSGPQWLAFQRIEAFRTRPAADWGQEYAALLKSAHLTHAGALLLLPREEVILRTLSLPGVGDEEAPAAIRFQLDALHPYPEEEILSDWQRLPGAGHFAIAIVERSRVTHYTELFAEAGISLAGISCSSAVIQSALRLYGDPAPEFLARVPGELYGESPARPLYSTLTDSNVERLIPFALSELRLAPETEVTPIANRLPAPKSLPASLQEEGEGSENPWTAFPIPYSGALAASCPHLVSPLNLLPVTQRAAASRVRYIPTVVLASLLGLTGLALAAQGPWQDRQYLALVQQEIAKLEPNARQVDALDKQIAAAAARSNQLDQFRQRSKADLDVLLELTRLLKSPAWVTTLELNRSSVSISGEAEQAEALLKSIDSSPMFESSEFTTPIAKGISAETFRIRAARENRR